MHIEIKNIFNITILRKIQLFKPKENLIDHYISIIKNQYNPIGLRLLMQRDKFVLWIILALTNLISQKLLRIYL